MKKRKKLMYDYISITFLIATILLTAFFLILHIAHTSMIRQARETSNVIFEQAKEQLEQLENDIENLRFNLIHDGDLISFLQSDDMVSRWEDVKSIEWLVGTNRRLNHNLENMILYDQNGKLIFSLGSAFFLKNGEIELDSVHFSNVLLEPKTNDTYYEVDIPVNSLYAADNYAPIGTITLLYNTGQIQTIVNGALLNSNSAIALLDGENRKISAGGTWVDSYSHRKADEMEENKQNIFHEADIGRTGWRLVSVVSKEGLLFGIERLSWVIYVTFIAVGLVMIFLCVSLYRTIIRPIIRQTSFMINFTSDTKQRMEVLEDNEIGYMAQRMNQMLDDIESLNTTIVESRKQYLDIQYKKKKTEMVAYKSQINPHFLYNTFECIRGMALSRGEKDIADITLALSDMFRFSVKGEEVVTVLESIRNLKRYAKIIDYRFAGRYKIDIEAKRSTFHYKLPKLLLQPLLENAILHGLETKIEGGFAQVCVEELENHLVLTVLDNGNGMEGVELIHLRDAMELYDKNGTIQDQESGIGVLNVYRRMRLFYGEDASFTIDSEPGKGTQIVLKLPIKKGEIRRV